MIKVIITALAFAFFFNELHQFHKKWKIDFRPFNCISCLASWSGLVFYFLPESVLNVILTMFVSGIIAPLFVKIYQRFYYGTI